MNLAMKINDSFNGNATSNHLINENLCAISCFRAAKRLLKVSECWSDNRVEKGTVHAKHPFTKEVFQQLQNPWRCYFNTQIN